MSPLATNRAFSCRSLFREKTKRVLIVLRNLARSDVTIGMESQVMSDLCDIIFF